MISRRRTVLSRLDLKTPLKKRKTDGFIEVQQMSVSQVVKELDEFFDEMRIIDSVYNNLRVDFIQHSSIRLLSDIQVHRKKFTRVVSLIRRFRDELPKWNEGKNLSLVKILLQKGFEKEARAMSAKLKIDHDEFFGVPDRQKRNFYKRKESVKKDLIPTEPPPVEKKFWDRKKKPMKRANYLKPAERKEKERLKEKKKTEKKVEKKLEKKIELIVQELNQEELL